MYTEGSLRWPSGQGYRCGVGRPRFHSRFPRRDFSRFSHTSDLKTGAPVVRRQALQDQSWDWLARCFLLLLLPRRSTSVQVSSSVRLMPQIQPSGRGLLPSTRARSPDQHPVAMLADVSRYISGRTEGRGLGFGRLVRTHRLVGQVVRRPPRERKIPGSNPAYAGIFSGSSHTSDLKIGTPVATLPGAWEL